MKYKVHNLNHEEVGNLTLKESVFGTELRKDILARVVNWQLAKRRAGTHSTKTISMISGTTRKPYRQKGTGNARQGSLRSPQFRGGATIFGPLPRSHAHDLPKKVRRLGLRVALSSKVSQGHLMIVDTLDAGVLKTKELASKIKSFGVETSALFVDGDQVPENFRRALTNIKGMMVLPQIGANVYDILRHDKIILTKDAVKKLEERLA